MKSLDVDDDPTISTDGHNTALDVQIVYEDKPVGVRAKRAFDAVADQFRGQGELRVTLWRFDLLRNPALRELATRTAAEADIILFSMHGRSPLPEAVSSWVIEWLAGRTDTPPALVVSLDEEVKDSAPAQQLLDGLRQVTQPTGIDVIPHYGPPADPEEPLTVERLQFRADLMTSVLGEALGRTQAYSYRYWGIND